MADSQVQVVHGPCANSRECHGLCGKDRFERYQPRQAVARTAVRDASKG